MMKISRIPARRDGIIFILSAPSGAGKTTLIKRLLKVFSDMTLSVSYTTRKPRLGEIQGCDYRFVAKESFLRMRKKGLFAEWALVHGSFYGTPCRRLEVMGRSGKDILLDIDTQGRRKIKRRFPDSVSVFLLPPTWQELHRRLATRGTERRDLVRKRLENARRELGEITEYDYFVVNRDIRKASENLRTIVLAERQRISRIRKWR
ncbi:MAG: guanylate kinase [Candidatus Binatia bacterium]|jgi:guanylate kinase|nr:guanylate kinase [Candidatus Binatia bacterium]